MVVVGSNPISRSIFLLQPVWWLSLDRVGCVVAAQAIPAGCVRRTAVDEHRGRQLDSPAAPPKTARPPVATKTRLDLDVQISDVGPCKKHLKVTIPRTDVEKQFNESLGEMTKEAVVPGFRPGRAPRQLVEKRFRKQVAGQVKSTLLMASLEQLDEEHKLNPITQPDLDVDAIELPDDGPMVFEMDVEVRPDFPLPAYKDLTLESPVKTIGEADIDAQVKAVPRALRPARPQARRRGRGRRLRHGRPRLPPRGEDLQRGQGDPVPAPARTAIPGRHGARDRRGPHGRQARRVARGRRPDRLVLARPRAPGQVDQGCLQRPRPQDAPPARD